LAILNIALENNPKSEVLLLSLLRETALLWESDKVLGLWKKVMSGSKILKLFFKFPDHSKNPIMWKEYVKFLQSNFSTFSVSQMRKAYSQAVSSLQSLLFQTVIGKPFPGYSQPFPGQDFRQIYDLESSLLEIFIQLCFFEKQSGYLEKAVAYFQTLIEFNYFCPENLVDYRMQMRYFEGFWESEVPRFGDEVELGVFRG
jgi:hypothetical protein